MKQEITSTASISPPLSPVEILEISEDTNKGESSSTSLLGVKDLRNRNKKDSTYKYTRERPTEEPLKTNNEITQSPAVSQSDETPNTATVNETEALDENEKKDVLFLLIFHWQPSIFIKICGGSEHHFGWFFGRR